MQRLYEKSQIWFSVAWIILYVVLTSIADSVGKWLTFVLHVIMCLVLVLWLKRNCLYKEYGLCFSEKKPIKFLYYIPLIFISTVNLWLGMAINMPLWETVFYIGSMLCVGFLEEIIFRGFLFKAMAQDNVKWAIIVSSLTFGIGHVVNLLNGASLLPTVCQIFEATAIGYLFVIIFYRGKSLASCIISHSFINATSAFARELMANERIIVSIIIFVVALSYGIILNKTLKGDEFENT